ETVKDVVLGGSASVGSSHPDSRFQRRASLFVTPMTFSPTAHMRISLHSPALVTDTHPLLAVSQTKPLSRPATYPTRSPAVVTANPKPLCRSSALPNMVGADHVLVVGEKRAPQSSQSPGVSGRRSQTTNAVPDLAIVAVNSPK